MVVRTYDDKVDEDNARLLMMTIELIIYWEHNSAMGEAIEDGVELMGYNRLVTALDLLSASTVEFEQELWVAYMLTKHDDGSGNIITVRRKSSFLPGIKRMSLHQNGEKVNKSTQMDVLKKGDF